MPKWTSAEIVSLKQEKGEMLSQLRSQVKAVVEEVTDLKDNIATIREDSKKVKEDVIQYLHEQLNERFAKWDERQTGPGVAQKKQVEATPEVMLVGELPSAFPPQEDPSTGFDQPLPAEVETYLKELSEDEKLVMSVQWLFHQMNTNTNLMTNEALTSISKVEDPRGRIIRAIQGYQSQKGSLQGR